MITEEDLDHLAEICDAATAGPWFSEWDAADPQPDVSIRGHSPTVYVSSASYYDGPCSEMSEPDAAFVVAAREYMPKLISALKSVLAERR